MTHILVTSGSATGGPVPRTLDLTFFQNDNTFNGAVLQYTFTSFSAIDRYNNPNTFYDHVLELVLLTELTLTHFANANEFFDAELAALPYDPVNDETEDLLAEFTGTYSTTLKIQMDTFITELKDAGVWAELDWFSCARFAVNEHDSLVDWTQPTRSMVKVGGVTFTPFVGWQGATPATADARLTTGYDPGDGPHGTATDLTVFAKITSIAAENGMQPFGVWRRITGGGPSTPDGIFLDLNVVSNSGFGGVNVNSGQGNTSFVGAGVGVWGITRGGGTTKTIKDGVDLESDAVSTTSGYTVADGISFAGSAGLAKRAFNGVQEYVGIASALSAAQLGAIEAALAIALLPPAPPAPVEPQTTPAYTEPGGTGDRRSDIIMSWSTEVNSPNKDVTDLIDGTTNATASSLFWETSSAAAEFIFDFAPLGFTQLIEEFKFYQSGTNTHGSWQVAGSDDGLTWTDIDAPFTLGGSTTQTKALTNTVSYRMYRFKKVSGSTNNSPFLYEFEFKLGGHRTITAIPVWVAPNTPGAITVTPSGGLIAAGSAANLVNGNTVESNTFFNSGITTASLIFDFGAAVVVAEARIYQDAFGQHGRWKWQGSNDNVSYFDLAALPADWFANGPNAVRILHGFGGNTTAYRYYKAVQVSGTTSNGPWVRELEFRKV